MNLGVSGGTWDELKEEMGGKDMNIILIYEILKTMAPQNLKSDCLVLN